MTHLVYQRRNLQTVEGGRYQEEEEEEEEEEVVAAGRCDYSSVYASISLSVHSCLSASLPVCVSVSIQSPEVTLCGWLTGL